jgi:ribosomal protein L29
MKSMEVHKMKDEELGVELARLRNDLYDLRSQGVTEKVEDTSRFPKLRGDIARVLTEQTARRRAGEGANGTAPTAAAKPQAKKASAAKAAPAAKKAEPKKAAAEKTEKKAPAKAPAAKSAPKKKTTAKKA